MTPRRLLWLLGIVTGLRLVVAVLVPLAPDEAYYWLWSRHLAAGYYDDAPLIAFWIRLGTAIAGPGPLGIRLFSPLGAALGSLLLWRAGEDLFPNRRAGAIAAILLNATLILNAGAIVTTPDTPLLLCWTAAIAAAGRWVATRNDRWWLACGIAAGLAFEAKYTGALLFPVLGLWLLTMPEGRAALRRPWPWVGLALGLSLMLPVVWWNATHHWASFAKQGSRGAHADLAAMPAHFAGFVLGQIGLATPLVAALMAWGVAILRPREPSTKLVLLAVLIPGAVFVEHTISGPVQANWPAILYPGAALAAGALGLRPGGKLPPAWLVASAALGAMLTLVVWAQAVAAPFPLPARRDPTAVQLAGWHRFADGVARIAARTHAGIVASTDYGTVAQLAHDLPPGLAVAGIGPRWRYFAAPPAPRRQALLVEPAHLAPLLPPRLDGTRPLGILVRRRGGTPIETYDILAATPKPSVPVIIMRAAR